jgi:hypothetical protein
MRIAYFYLMRAEQDRVRASRRITRRTGVISASQGTSADRSQTGRAG